MNCLNATRKQTHNGVKLEVNKKLRYGASNAKSMTLWIVEKS